MISKEQIARDYDEFWESGVELSDDWTRLGMKPLRMQAIHSIESSPGRILDVGCGNGLALATLERLGRDAVGCDISLRALRDARIHGPVARADACRLPFRNETFRHVLMLDALEHVIEKAVLMRECHRVLAKGGDMVLTTPLPKATAGAGDDRQPYDKPSTYPEIVEMTSGLFRLRMAKGIGWAPRGFGRLARLIPRKVYATFPLLLENSAELLLVFEKR